MVSFEPVHVSVKVKGTHVCQLTSWWDEARQCKIVAMYWLQRT